jgi:DNA-directed RNA polymerase subunit M/transcription elongation factor TFIIS
MNIITSNQDISKMLDAGEPVTLIGGNRSFLITNGCPEFFLYPHEHKMVGMGNHAVHQYSFDEEYKSDKFIPQGSRHYTECPEYSLSISKKRNLFVRKKIQPKVKMKLQQEIGSKCPFCSNEEVEYFQVHHIDENPTNNNFDNLLMLCQICHSKFTKGDKKTEDAIEMKGNLIRK